MNPFSRFLFFTLAGICLSGTASAQGNTNPYQNRLIAKYYTPAELDYLKANLPAHFDKLKFYFIYSFQVTAIPCSSCPAIELSLVDVSEFESQRLPNQVVTVTDTVRGFTITLISQRQLDLLYMSSNAPKERPRQIDGIKCRLFPTSLPMIFRNRNMYEKN